MGIFSLTQEIAVDLGTANTIIIHNDKIVVDEPSYVALDSKGKLVAVGEKAKMMQGKEHPGIRTIRPLRDGVIADFNAAELMIRGLIKMVSSKHHWFSPSLRIVVCIPSGSTEVEIRAVRDSSEHAGGRDVYMIYEPMAAALGIGLDVEAPEGNMIVDIGGGTTEIAVISLGGIVTNKSIRVAGDVLTEDIQEHMRRAHSMKVGERMAELIKINVGSTLTEMDNPPEDYIVHGPNQMTALPMEVPVSYQEISHCIEKSILKIEAAILSALESTPPELYADIVRNGIYISGGGEVTSYFNLRSINSDLQERNATLEMEVINLKRQIGEYKTLLQPSGIALPDSVAQNYEYHFANVINNSVTHPKNFITIDKGRLDGIAPEMGVVDQNGVVGIVSNVSDHASRVLSLLNSDMRLSCKVKNTDYFGSLVWHGTDPYHATLEEMPKHVKFHRGDTIVTSGYSAVFPPGLIVGVIESNQQATDNNFFSLKIRLTTDFTRLGTVRAIKSKMAGELKRLEQEGGTDNE